MKVLITGGSGFIGTHVIDALLMSGVPVLNLDIAEPKLDSHLPLWRAADILDLQGLSAAFADFRPTHVIHLAARTDTFGVRLDEYRVNTDGTRNVLQAISNVGTVVRAVITSTQFVNQYAGLPKGDLDFSPHTVYGESKVITEQATRAAGLQCDWVIIRPTNIWGPWHLRYPSEFWKILGRGFYFHPTGGRVVRSYGYVKNVAWQVKRILDADSNVVSGKVFYVGDRPIDLLDWVNGFSRRQIGRDVWTVPRGFIRGLGYVGDALSLVGLRFPITSSRYKSMTTSNDAPMESTFAAFGEPPHTLDMGIQQTVEWLRHHHPDLVRC